MFVARRLPLLRRFSSKAAPELAHIAGSVGSDSAGGSDPRAPLAASDGPTPPNSSLPGAPSTYALPPYEPFTPTTSIENLRFRHEGYDDLGFASLRLSLHDYFLGNDHHIHHVFFGGSVLQKQAKKVEQRTFEDVKFIRVSSGRGGNGAVTFFRDANRPVGPPDGGDGGAGGNVYLRVVNTISSLHKIKRSYVARPGASGSGSQLDGKNGEDVIIEVPVGTSVRWIPDPRLIRQKIKLDKDLSKILLDLKAFEQDKKLDIQFFRQGYAPGDGWIFKEQDEEYYRERSFFSDLNKMVENYDQEIVHEELVLDTFPLVGMDFDKPLDQPVLLLKGGKGGMGNMHFLTKDVRNPRFSKVGRAGVSEFFLLELKLIADLGLVGLPNAGKSTLLRAISKAKPRVGHWEFTTLQPTIGTISTSIDREPFTVADIPGIIKGASENKGMGLDFLRHIERLGGLVFVVSLESQNPVQDLKTLVREVGPKRMQDKRVLVIATKADLTVNGDAYEKLRYFTYLRKWKIVPVCAPNGENIERCVQLMEETARGLEESEEDKLERKEYKKRMKKERKLVREQKILERKAMAKEAKRAKREQQVRESEAKKRARNEETSSRERR